MNAFTYMTFLLLQKLLDLSNAFLHATTRSDFITKAYFLESPVITLNAAEEISAALIKFLCSLLHAKNVSLNFHVLLILVRFHLA